MCNWVETICIRSGKIENIKYHQERFDRTRKDMLGIVEPLILKGLIRLDSSLLWVKCRVLYRDHIVAVTYEPYVKRTVQSLKIVTDDTIDYTYKSADRSALNRLFELRGQCDDILIVKNGLLTDTFSSNIVLTDGTEWVTPAHPLLCGTRRQQLLDEGRIRPAELKVSDIKTFKEIYLINAMLRLEDCVRVDVSNVF